MLLENLLIFSKRNDKYKQEFARYLKSADLKENERDDILEKLCSFLMDPKYTRDVGECFPQHLMLLLSQTIRTAFSLLPNVRMYDKLHQLNSVILGILVSVHPDVLGLARQYFQSYPAPFGSLDDNLAVVSKRRKENELLFVVREITTLEIVKASYNILKAEPEYFRHKWDWSEFYNFLLHEEDAVRWIALKCIGIVVRMSESTLLECGNVLLKDSEHFLASHSEKTNVEIVTGSNNMEELNELSEKCNTLVSIAGVLLPVFNPTERRTKSNLVPVPSMESNLRSLALAVASGRCICLKGSVGCGKSALVEYLAEITGRGGSNLIKVQLGDQTDSKMLLGTYRCTEIPGEFVWQPGVLTQAVIEGKWLLLEDIDSAALDVASCLRNLVESGRLAVPGYRDTIYPKSGFQLFLTQRLVPTVSGFHRQSTGIASNLLEKDWFCIHVESLAKNELIDVIKTLFPPLTTIAMRMVDVYLLFSDSGHEASDQSQVRRAGRFISTRDLIKWCDRAIVNFEVSSPDSALKIFQDAIDIFCCSLPDRHLRLELAVAIGHTLGIVKTKAEYFCNTHKPTVHFIEDIFKAGRAKLRIKSFEHARVEQTRAKFSFTRPSAVLLERVTSCVAQKEPVLLVGETGTGKTCSVQYLAKSTGHKLVVINMNQQSESADLLGGYKPVDLKYLISPIKEEFEILFRSYFALEPNRQFLNHVASCYNQQRWKTLVGLMHHSAEAAVKRLRAKLEEEKTGKISVEKTNNKKNGKSMNEEKKINKTTMLMKWEKVLLRLQKLKAQVKTHVYLAFAFIEGSLIKALHGGDWVLLDEINLASSETLECLSGLLEGATGSLSLLERGDSKMISRHPDFTIFACMNPATDVGKKELPVGLRNRFTEFYVDELTDKTDLQLLVNSYLAEANLPREKEEQIVKFYLNVRKEASMSLNDGTGHKPHYSLRTLCRALSVASTNPCGNIQRSLYESFCLSFLTQLDHHSYLIVEKMIARAIFDAKMAKAIMCSPIPKPVSENEDFINFEGYWIIKGKDEIKPPNNYILTNSVKRNLRDLVRVVSIGKMPVLLQGETSVGKTSLITYLAKSSGHTCFRINNHEHTDLQEYVGSYVADQFGRLLFKEGILVKAMREGHWIILDELNLAPSDVLEALNRVLDDNRELFIPETQQVVKAHPNFMLFATQNPPGVYGGRKVLSRAFRNRFVELHFDEIPADELQTILHRRCHMPLSYCKQIINVMTELQMRRKSTATFQGKYGFITLRDLFRWGERYRLAEAVGQELYDWSQHLADEGYLVLAAKVRKSDEAEEIRQVIKKHLKKDVDPSSLFSLHENTSSVTRFILEDIFNSSKTLSFPHVVWTYHMRRMAVLVRKSCQFKEPVLLVGETGGGKTTICQLIAAMNDQKLYAVNCHMHTESSDFLGNLRPVRDHSESGNQKLFEWLDGPLITAMQSGDLFLADEISLADDSVLERLNSLLEPERSLLLAEKSADSIDCKDSDCIITANERFHFIGTMNPGGDYGKKELSPALRNRFTEIWCEGCVDEDDLRAIVEHNLTSQCIRDKRRAIATLMLKFIDWLKESETGKRFTVSVRDILTWVNFINSCTGENKLSKLSLFDAYFHGACLTYIDSLGSGLTGMESAEKLSVFRRRALSYLKVQTNEITAEACSDKTFLEVDEATVQDSRNVFGIAPFFIRRRLDNQVDDCQFTFAAPTTESNTLKLLRALQLKKPLLLEGSPGVGKTSLVAALARASGHNLLRINLSDQTDVSDLFGADLPLEGGRSGQFSWKDGPFLRALRAGDWILLDELNLASQSVLEGLNACLDHRGEIYIPELGRTFTVKPATKLFGCQNPLREGGARRGLPKSFLNRFTQVYVDALNDDDLKLIASNQFPEIPLDLLGKMVEFNSKLASEAGTSWAHSGAPWEMNLRDIIRWCEAMVIAAHQGTSGNDFLYNPSNGVDIIYINRMRSEDDRRKVREIYQEMFSVEDYPFPAQQPVFHLTGKRFYIGDISLPREEFYTDSDHDLLLLRDQLSVLRSLVRCVEMNWMPILVGGPGCGKSSVIRVLAKICGQKLKSVVVNSAMDTTEILGGFEQTDYNRHLEELLERVEALLMRCIRSRLTQKHVKDVVVYHSWLDRIQKLSHDKNDEVTMAAETELFLRRTEELQKQVFEMKRLDDTLFPELEVIEEKLRQLSERVHEDKCVNAGGKFEWVDSILVKCLQEGSWLLLNQVNLCSPAVLDRLNGLLEPGGVLTIGERGVGEDGKVLTIKPHKNFRLFLTMDPRYGEISRAMRNRGVEIFMLGHKEDSSNDILDLRSLLCSRGLKRSNHQEALLEIHEKMSLENSTPEKQSLVHLLHSAFLINQQISRGFPATEAFRISCLDVYVKSRYVQDPARKERLRTLIEDAIIRHDVICGGKNFFDLTAVTPRVSDLTDNSKLTIIRQQGFLLDSALKIFEVENRAASSQPRTSIINSFFDHPEKYDDFDLNDLFSYFLLRFYEKSTINDVHLRRRWLNEKLNQGVDSEVLKNLMKKNELLANEIAGSKEEVGIVDLPWDSVDLPSILENDDRAGRANRLALILYLIAMNRQYPRILDDTSFDKNEKFISLQQYSSSVYHGKLTSHLRNQPLITNFVLFIAQLESCVNMLFHEKSTHLSCEDYVNLRMNFSWFQRFYSLGKMTLIDKTEKSSYICTNLDETMLMLRVHYKWLVKFIKIVFGFVRKFDPSDECKKEFEKLSAMLRDIDRSVKSDDDPFRKISKQIKKYLVMPLPFSSETAVKGHTELRRLSDNFSLCMTDREESTLKSDLKIILLEKPDARKARREMINIWKCFYIDRDFKEATFQILGNIEDFCQRSNLGLRTSIEMSQALGDVQACREREIIDMSANVQLWPIYEYIFFILVHNLLRNICEDRETQNNLVTLEKLSEIPSLPINLIGLLQAATLRRIGSDERNRMKYEIFVGVDRFVESSELFRNSEGTLHWQGISEPDVEKSMSNRKNNENENPLDSPVLVNLLSELIVNKSRTIHDESILATARLGTYSSRMRQLKTLNELLWRNSVSLNSPDYEKDRNDRLTLASYLKVFLTVEEKMAIEGDSMPALQSEISMERDEGRVELAEKFQRDYLDPLSELKRKAREISDSPALRENDLVERAKAWVHLGYLQVFLFGNLGYIDPIHKIGLKIRYLEEDIEDSRRTIYVANLEARIRGDSFPSANTSRRTLSTKDSLELLEAEKKKLKTCKAVRPSSTEFVSLAKETSNFRKTLASWQTVKKIITKLLRAIEELNTVEKLSPAVFSTINDGLQEAEIWQESLKRFSEQLDKKFFSGYPDIVIPILTAVAQLKHGVRHLSDETRRLLRLDNENRRVVKNLMHNLVRFPSIGRNQSDLLDLVELCTSPETREVINKNARNEGDDAFVPLIEQFRMVKVGLLELYNRITLEGKLEKNLWCELNGLLQQIVLIWQREREENEKRAAEKDSLYVNKVKVTSGTPSEEEEIEHEFRALFPTTRDEDFQDIEKDSPTLERVENEIKDFPTSRQCCRLITDDDVNQVHVLHSRIVRSFVDIEWMKKRVTDVERNYVEPLIQRYNTFSVILEKLLPAMDSRLNSKLYTSLNFLTTVTLRTSQGNTNDVRNNWTENSMIHSSTKTSNFYTASNVQEAKQCLPILEMISDRVDGFLNEWPDHPTLKSIKSIIHRIYGFSIISPISRFLTGLELLLVKMKEWEENAHSGVSLAEISYTLTQQIISWRRLELACWKDCLANAEKNLASKASKWWFFLYALVESYSKNTWFSEAQVPFETETPKTDEPVTSKKLVELLESFLGSSSLIEFEPRLELLLIFHSHAYYLPESNERDQLLAVFWNIYHYFKQFVPEVSKKINSVKTPIEKKLRDFVKIARWNDINYWSVKETVDKTHRTLHKFIREYESGLKESVAGCLIVKPSSFRTENEKGEWDRSKERDYEIDPRDFVFSGKINPKFTTEEMQECQQATELIRRMESFVLKAKRLSEETIRASPYPVLRNGLEELMETTISHAARLRDMDIDRTQPKPKQKSQAKSILQQKRMALADYFKTLSYIGLSYRAGTLAWKNRQDQVIDFTVPPVDLQASLDTFKHSKADRQLLAQWKGCENYYYRSLIKLNALNAIFTKVQSDLGTPNMERCAGFSNHGMLMANKQKRRIAESFNNYVSLRKQFELLSTITADTNGVSGYHNWIDCASGLKKLVVTLQTGLEQLSLYLQACPSDSGFDESVEALILETSHLPIVNAKLNDAIWESANSLLQRCLSALTSIAASHEKVFQREILIYTPLHHEFLTESNKTILNLKSSISEFSRVFSSSTEQSHPIVQTIQFLESEIDEWIQAFLLMRRSEEISLSRNFSTEYISNVESLVKTMLLAIQEKYKETLSKSQTQGVQEEQKNSAENEENKNTDETEEVDSLVENGFRKEIIESLEKDLVALHLAEVNTYLVNVIKMSTGEDMTLTGQSRFLIIRCLPLLKQYLLFSQYYLNEQIGAFRMTCKLLSLQLNVFLDLATNGFCIPKDLNLEEGEGEETQEGSTQGGMGLGDGVGEKDVSDRIESEDQLEDAKPAGQEKEKEEDEDCKEEQNGIDMSENFDGKLQDVERNEDEDGKEKESEDENEEELDKEMGDTEQGADALDEEIWGDDNEESTNENEEREEENQGKGQEIGEKEMGAKDDGDERKEENEDNEKGDRTEEEKPEINEMNEPEFNDDQIDPYHGNVQPPPEPESMDLPDDINLDNEDVDDKQQGDEVNPFDIDEMKECMPPPDKEESVKGDEEKEEGEEDDKEPAEDSSDEDEENSLEKGEPKSTVEESPQDGEPESEVEKDPENQIPEAQKDLEQDKDEEIGENKASASMDDPSKEIDASDQQEAVQDGSRDKVATQENMDESEETKVESNENERGKNQGIGSAQSERQDAGHSGDSMQNTSSVQHREKEKQQMEKRRLPGESDENRSLVDKIEPDTKKMKMIHSREDTDANEEEEGAEINEDRSNTEMCEHVKSSEKYDDQAMDAATKEQVEKQVVGKEEEEKNEEELMDVEVNLQVEEEELRKKEEETAERNSEVVPESDKTKEKEKNDLRGNREEGRVEGAVEVEGNVVETTRVERGTESAFFTSLPDPTFTTLSSAQVVSKRMEVERMLSRWTHVPSSDEALAAWNCLSSVVEASARDLAEKLRLVLEPTQATRLKGDYRTGRRINMRKIIPYIASQFRKDKIWLRRTKPSKRDYQVVLALDDSSSMADNHSKELAFESLSLISKAMTYLEVGELSVISFGETISVLHPLGQPFTENSGSRLIQEMRFDQKKTKVGQLVDFTVDMFESQKSSTDSAKLLVVLSDGRGVFSEGVEQVNSAVRRARLADIFLVFIIVDNPLSKDSILDIRMPVFEAGKLLGIKSYMDSFPFPFYMILRDINGLPGVLSDALRQWFEIVGKIDI